MDGCDAGLAAGVWTVRVSRSEPEVGNSGQAPHAAQAAPDDHSEGADHAPQACPFGLRSSHGSRTAGRACDGREVQEVREGEDVQERPGRDDVFGDARLPQSDVARLRYATPKRAKELRKRKKLIAEMARNGHPLCVRCGRLADDLHEVLSRARGGSIADPENCRPLCRPCHTWVTEHPVEAKSEGLSR